MRALIVVLLAAGGCASVERRPNVLMIVVDDLRPFIGAYGAPAHTPSIDALVARGALFDRAYCQQALCNPSRSALLTGRRPETLGVHTLWTHFRARWPKLVTLPEYFKLHGWRAVAIGKVFHGDMAEDAQSWSEPIWMARRPQYGARDIRDAIVREAARRFEHGERAPAVGPSWEAPDIPDTELRDGDLAAHAVETLRRLASRPFFLAVGFSRPHLPFVAPRRYYDLYPLDRVALAPNPFPPAGAPPPAIIDSDELRAYTDIPKEGPIPDDKARELVRGYQASVSYIDAQIGRVLDELDALGLRERTIVVLWGDHGLHLGEHGIWCKSTVFEVAARAPIVVSAPGQRARGAKIRALVELVDVYPTLAQLAKLPAPGGLEGTSFVPLLAEPSRTWKRAAFTEQPREEWFGRSMRTENFRYTEWVNSGDGQVLRELYDHRSDPDENVNVADRPEQRALVEKLAAQLHAGWRAALPAR